MRFLMILAVFALCVPTQTMAAELFNRVTPEEEKGQELEESLGLAPPKQEPEGTISENLANAYYKNCLEQEDKTMSKETQKMLCACTAAKMTEEMTEKEIQAMFQNTPEGAYQRNRMITFVYVPCMEYPTRDLVYANCASDPEIKKSLKNSKKVCSCLAEKMGKFVSEKGMDILDGNIDAQNHLAALMNSPSFEAYSQQQIKFCIWKKEFGW